MKRDIIIILLVFIGACKSIESGKPTLEMNFSNEEKQLADSLLMLALDNEALYTIVEPIKPISTVLNFSLPIARADSIPSGVREATNPKNSHNFNTSSIICNLAMCNFCSFPSSERRKASDILKLWRSIRRRCKKRLRATNPSGRSGDSCRMRTPP